MAPLDHVAIRTAIALDDHAAIAVAVDMSTEQRPDRAVDDGAGNVAIAIPVPIMTIIILSRNAAGQQTSENRGENESFHISHPFDAKSQKELRTK